MPLSLYQKALLTMMFKLINSDHVPDFFRENLKTVNQLHCYEIRHSSKLLIPVKPKSPVRAECSSSELSAYGTPFRENRLKSPTLRYASYTLIRLDWNLNTA